VNDLAVDDFVDRIEMWNIERPYRFDGERDDVFHSAGSLLTPRLLGRGSKRAQHPGTIESLALTMVAETHIPR
jgi:hypothetical protein